MYGLPQVGILANKKLRKNLAPAGFYEIAPTPGSREHKRRQINSYSLLMILVLSMRERTDRLPNKETKKHYEKITID